LIAALEALRHRKFFDGRRYGLMNDRFVIMWLAGLAGQPSRLSPHECF